MGVVAPREKKISAKINLELISGKHTNNLESNELINVFNDTPF